MLTMTQQGGTAHVLSPILTLNRYLMLGIQDSYYETEAEALNKFIKTVSAAIDVNSGEVVATILNARNKAPRPNACIIATAILAAHPKHADLGWGILSQVVRNGSHMQLFVRVAFQLRGWGRRPKRIIGEWYKGKGAFDVLKYGGRTWYGERIETRQIFHKVHRQYINNDDLYNFVTDGVIPDSNTKDAELIRAVSALPEMGEAEMLQTITDYRLPWEMIPTEKRTKTMWEAILPHIGGTALFRNMGTLAVRNVDPHVIQAALARATEHPINILVAWYMYRQGHGNRSDATWIPNQVILESLEEAFYRGFDSVPKTDQKLFFGLDVSSSMNQKNLMGVEGLTPRTVAAVMAMQTVRTATNPLVYGFASELQEFPINDTMTLGDVIKNMEDMRFGNTDISAPVRKMLTEDLDIDALLVYSDGQTNGKNDAIGLRKKYRAEHPLKYVEVNMVPNDLTFVYSADDATFTGFAADLPQSISTFLTV